MDDGTTSGEVTTLDDPTAVPSVAQLAKAIKPEMSDAQLAEYYAEHNMRKVLY